MTTRREFLKYTLFSLALPLLPKNALASDESVLIGASNKLMDPNTATAFKNLLQSYCYSSENKITCEIEYGTNKSRTNLVNKLLPELKPLIENKDRNYLSTISMEDKVIGIKIYTPFERNIVLSLPKASFSSEEKKDILHIEDILNDLFRVTPKNMFKEGKESDINCISSGKNYVKCMLQYESTGKRAKFINAYAPRINLVKNNYFIEIDNSKKYRSLKIRVTKGLNITLEAKNY
ncbi:MAG: hypothetical protein AB1571_02045 [Nanoarchaeota archaeon]